MDSFGGLFFYPDKGAPFVTELTRKEQQFYIIRFGFSDSAHTMFPIREIMGIKQV